MGSFSWVEPDWQATITDLRIERANGETVWIEPCFGPVVTSPCELSAGDVIYVGYRYWNDRKHGWDAAQSAEYTSAGGDVTLDVLASEVFAESGGSNGQAGGSGGDAGAAMLVVISYPPGADLIISLTDGSEH